MQLMFVRKKTSRKNPNTYVQLIESYRENGKNLQRVVKHIGTARNNEQLEQVLIIAESVKQLLEKNVSESDVNHYIQKEFSKIQDSGSDVLHCQPIRDVITGIHEVYGEFFDRIGVNQLIGSSAYSQVLRDIVMARIATPSSKRQACKILEEDFDILHSLNSVYRMMDKINPIFIEEMKKKIANYNISLLKGKIQVLFYDVTTIYFESFTSDELKKLGYSKDNKFNQPQIVLSLLATEEGLPLGYQLFPGNTYEGHTLISAIRHWKTLYSEQSFVLVADSGMLNGVNLELLEQENINYIVCARIKNLPKLTKEKILSDKQEMLKEQNASFFLDFPFKERRLIISYKLDRAKKDRIDRERAIEGLRNKLQKSKNPATLISNYGYKKYITIEKSSQIALNEEKIEKESLWDGLHGLITNLKEEEAHVIYNHYRGLWTIEDAFRIKKSDLKIRPIFHWTPHRVEAHIALSYMAYSCYKGVEFIVNRTKKYYSHRRIQRYLTKARACIVRNRYTQVEYFMPFELTPQIKRIYKAMEIAPQEQSYRIV